MSTLPGRTLHCGRQHRGAGAGNQRTPVSGDPAPVAAVELLETRVLLSAPGVTAVDDAYAVEPTDMFRPLIVPAGGVLANDGGTSLAVTTTGEITTALGAVVQMQADGGFTYCAAPAGALQNLDTGTVVTDSFAYSVADAGGATGTATVTVVVTCNGENSIHVIDTPSGGKTLVVKGSTVGDKITVALGPVEGDYEVVTTEAPGDANLDGSVDLQDFGILKNHFGQGGRWGDANFNGDCVVDLQDFSTLKAHFGWKDPFRRPGNEPGINRVIVFGMGGDDQIAVHSTAEVSAWIFGGAGNDKLDGGAGNDLLVGGDGDDHMLGISGRDVMIAGLGADQMTGNAQQDILIAGVTAYDDLLTALEKIQAEWLSDTPIEVRAGHLLGDAGGLNGPLVLNTSPALGTVTVFDDHSADTLSGGGDADWLMANLDGGDTLDKAPTQDGDLFSELEVMWI